MKKIFSGVFLSIVIVGASISSAQTLTGPQKNAARSANAHLSISSLSREGLIEQLSSSFGDGYDAADATAAVDSLSEDWNEQAEKPARQYLSISGSGYIRNAVG